MPQQTPGYPPKQSRAAAVLAAIALLTALYLTHPQLSLGLLLPAVQPLETDISECQQRAPALRPDGLGGYSFQYLLLGGDCGLYVLPAEAAFDAEVAVGHAVVIG